MAHNNPDPSRRTTGMPHARGVRPSQGAADVRGRPPLSEADAHNELLRILVTAHGTDGVRRMLDALR